MRLYGQFSKIEAQDDGTVRVEGIASSESIDDQGEIIQAAAMRAALPDYMKFPALREMHQLLAAGTTLEADVDLNGVTRIVGHVVDPVAVTKIKTNVYRGFSIGGQVTARDIANRKIITGIKLNEISLVDRPANPEAIFDCWKASAIIEGTPDMLPGGLTTIGDTTAGEKLAALAAKLEPVQVWACGNAEHRHVAKADASRCIEGFTTANTLEAAKGDTSPGEGEEIGKRAGEQIDEVNAALLEAQRAIERGEVTLVKNPAVDELTEKSGSVDNTPAQPNPNSAAVLSTAQTEAQRAAIAKGGDAPGDGSKPYGDETYADPGYRSDGKKRYPVTKDGKPSEGRIRAAWNYISKPANCAKYSGGDCAKVKAKIVAAWKDHIDSDGPPSASEKVSRAGLAKALWDVGQVAHTILTLNRLKDDLGMEALMEGDDSPQPARLQAIIGELCDFLNALVAEETAEILDDTEIDIAQPLGMDMGPVAMSAIAGSLSKTIADKGRLESLMDKLRKAGARHNAMDQMHLDRAASNTHAAMSMEGCTKADMVHLSDVHKSLLDAGAMAHQTPAEIDGGGGEDSLSGGGATQHSTVDTGHNAETRTPNPTGAVPKASDMSTMFDALGKSGALAGSDDIVADAVALYKAGGKPHQVLANLAHGHVAAACDGATCKEDAAKPSRHSGETMAHLHKAHFGLTKCSGAMKCDAAAAMIPGGTPSEPGESEGQGTRNTAGKATGGGADPGSVSTDLVKATTALTQMVAKLADQVEVKTKEVEDLKKANAAHEQRLEVVENQPLPPKTAAAGTVPISKEQDGARRDGEGPEAAIAKRQAIYDELTKASDEELQTLGLTRGEVAMMGVRLARAAPIVMRGRTDGPAPASPRP